MPEVSDFTVDHQPFLAEKLADGSVGYTWTLASRLGQMLKEAEAQFGPQDSAYTFVGVEFAAEGPCLSFPGSDRHVIVQLSLNSLDNIQKMCFELAHQSVGLLSPTRDGSRSVLSEGLAAQFAATYMREHFHSEWITDRTASLEAQSLVADLLEFSPDLIKTLRESQPILSKITADLILAAYPEIPRDIAEAVTTPVTGEIMLSVASDIQSVPLRQIKASETISAFDQADLITQLREENRRLNAALERSQLHVGQALEALAAEQRRLATQDEAPARPIVSAGRRIKMADMLSEASPETAAPAVRKRSTVLDTPPDSISAQWNANGLDMSPRNGSEHLPSVTELDEEPEKIVQESITPDHPARPTSRVWKWLMGESAEHDYS